MTNLRASATLDTLKAICYSLLPQPLHKPRSLICSREQLLSSTFEALVTRRLDSRGISETVGAWLTMELIHKSFIAVTARDRCFLYAKKDVLIFFRYVDRNSL